MSTLGFHTVLLMPALGTAGGSARTLSRVHGDRAARIAAVTHAGCCRTHTLPHVHSLLQPKLKLERYEQYHIYHIEISLNCADNCNSRRFVRGQGGACDRIRPE